MSRIDVIREARKHLGKPYKPFGLNPSEGLGCIGAIFIPAARAGYECREFYNYQKPTPGRAMPRFLPQLQRQMIQIPLTQATIGDVYLLTMGAHGQHLALITAEHPRRILHSLPFPFRGVQENLFDESVIPANPHLKWSSLAVAAFRFSELRIGGMELLKNE